MQVRRHQSLSGARAVVALWLAGAVVSGCRTPPVDHRPARGTLLVFSDLRGALKPCGCSPDLQRGGVDRIGDYVGVLRTGEPELPLLHAGDLLLDDEGIPAGREGQITRRVEALAEALRIIGVQAATLGPSDLAAGPAWVERSVKTLPLPLVGTNVGAPWSTFLKRSLVLRVDSLRVGVLAALPPAPGVTSPAEALRAEATVLRPQVDVIVALSSLGLRETKRLFRADLGIDVVVAAGQDLKAVVTDEVESAGTARLIQSHIQGSHVGRLELSVTAGAPVSLGWALQAILWDRPRHPDIAAVMKRYDADLEAINLKAAGTLPPLPAGAPSYVGQAKCLECHEQTQAFIAKDRHPLAWETLEKDGKTFDLECVSCHSTGYGQAGGSILGAMKGLVDVQCESCHGPGSRHADDGDTATIRRVVPESVCVTCHNPKHSTQFNYDTYRSRLLVPGHGR